MSEYWVSKKKYFCKYCEIYIADDAPSRNHHESGMRHKGNLERFIRGIYKTGEKRKKDLEEEKREMARVELLANAAFAQDVGAGRASAVAGPSSASRRPTADLKSSNPYANYSTAESLGYEDPDAERLAREAEIRRSQGVAGEWEVISTTPTPAPDGAEEGDVKPDVASIGDKRPAESTGFADHEDTRSFKLRKKTLGAGLGEVYDPGLIPIKVKKRTEEVKKEEEVVPKSEGQAPPPPPTWAPIQLKPGTSSKVKEEDADNTTVKQEPGTSAPSSSGSKWVKTSWGEAAPSGPRPPPPPPPAPAETATTDLAAAEALKVKEEEDTKPVIPPTSEPPAPMFKKRKAPASSARGRRPM
ncbi:hypothetical protein D9611_003859 [Ephemerocybe angulata]|uniref:Matrin-type domain-containing protein n=1 Tax=Ephemerocybe angulata TaxID=980116 RepID=A0A8H5B748_9AGAR|nr:hypothetical protein D9611_003859 [Tulosesus angulatus]